MSELTDSVDAPKRSKRGTNPNSLANLRPAWKPGESGNPAGERGPIITPILRRFADMTVEELQAIDATKLTVGQAVAYTIVVKAMTDKVFGDKTREELLKRLDGPVSDGAHATAVASVVNIIRGGSGLGMEP